MSRTAPGASFCIDIPQYPLCPGGTAGILSLVDRSNDDKNKSQDKQGKTNDPHKIHSPFMFP